MQSWLLHHSKLHNLNDVKYFAMPEDIKIDIYFICLPFRFECNMP